MELVANTCEKLKLEKPDFRQNHTWGIQREIDHLIARLGGAVRYAAYDPGRVFRFRARTGRPETGAGGLAT